jgi:tetratricopeptide (TPR) repeat protein
MAAKANPKAAQRLLIRGHYAAINGSYKTALKLLNKAILLKPDYDTAYFHRGVLKSNIKDINGAIDDFSQAVRLNPRYSLPYFNRGTLYLQYGFQQKALADFDAAIQINPQFYDALNNKAVLLNAMGKPQEARQIYDSLINVFDGLNSKKGYLNSWSLLPNQTDAFRSYTALKPRVPRFYFNRSFIKVQINDLEGALQDLDKTLYFNPYDYAAYYQKGQVLLQLKQYKPALNAFDHARSLHPAAFYGHLSLGKAYATVGQTRKAIVLFNQAIRRNQQSGEAYFLRGSEKLKQKKMAEAYSDLRVAKQLGYSAAAEKLEQMGTLKEEEYRYKKEKF